MKKIFLTLMIAAFTCINSVQAVYVPQDVTGTEFEKDVELLVNLGLLEYTETGMMKPYSNMKRAEFAQFLDGMIGSKSVSGKDYFADVDAGNPARESINRLCEYGYISGDGNSLFRPDDDITINEAVKIMISIMGYDTMAQYQGGYPDGYLAIAGSLGITDNVITDNGYINRGNVMKLLINCFEVNPVEIDIDKGVPGVSVNEDSTVLAELAGIYKLEGYVNANSDYAISGGTANKGYIRVGNEEMISSGEYDDYVGYYVDCYYKETDGDEYEVIYLEKDERKTEYIKSNAEDVTEISDFACNILVDSKKDKKIKFGVDTVFVYNGRLCKGFNKEMLDFENGWIDFIDSNSDGTFDLIKINEYYNTVVESVTSEKIYDKYNIDGTIEYDKKDIRVFDAEGNQMSIADVKKNDVLSVFKSGETDDDIVKIICSSKTVSGTVSSKSEEDGIIFVTLNYEKYPVYNGFRTDSTKSVSMNDAGEFMLDAFGKIVSVKGFTSDVYLPACVLKSKAFEDENTGEMVLRIRLVTESGVIFADATDKVKVDNILYNSGEFESVSKSLQARIGQVILYKTNSKGNVIAVDTTDSNSTDSMDDRLTAGPTVSTSESLRYHSGTRVAEGRFPLDENAKVFILPSDIENAEDNEFAVKSVANGIGSNISGAETYRLNKNSLPVDYIVMKGSTQLVNHQSNIAVVKKINTTMNKYDEIAAELVLDVYGSEKTILTKNMDVLDKIKYLTKYSRSGDTLVDFEAGRMTEIKPGDIIKYSTGSDGYIECIVIIYSAEEGKMHSANPYHNDFHEQGYRYVQGEVIQKYGEYIMLSVNNGARTECHRIGMAGIYEVDTDDIELFKQISVSELKDRETYGVGDKVIIIMQTGSQLLTLLYR